MGGQASTYIVKREEIDKKTNFSPFQLELRKGVDISYPEIKKAGRSQTTVVNNNCPGKIIKPKNAKKNKK